MHCSRLSNRIISNVGAKFSLLHAASKCSPERRSGTTTPLVLLRSTGVRVGGPTVHGAPPQPRHWGGGGAPPRPSRLRRRWVDADTLNTFKSRLNKHWLDQDVLYNFHFELTGTGGASVGMWCCKRYGKEEYLRPFIRIGLDWIAHTVVQQLTRFLPK